MLSRWSGYLLAIDTADNASVVFEFTPPGAVVLDEAVKEFGTLRGMKIIATRPTKKDNGKVHLQALGISDRVHKLPPEEDLWVILARIWGLATEFEAAHQAFLPNEMSEHERVVNGMQNGRKPRARDAGLLE